MPSVDPLLAEDLSISDTDDDFVVKAKYHVRDLVLPTNGSVIEMFASALSVSGIPPNGDPLSLPGHDTVYVNNRQVTAWAPADAQVLVSWGLNNFSNTNTVRTEIGSTAYQANTELDKNGDPLTVTYTAPGGGTNTQKASAPGFFPKSSYVFTKIMDSDPGALSKQYVGKKNSVTWKGEAAGTFICMAIVGRLLDNGKYEVTFAFEYDDLDKWKPLMIWVDPVTGQKPKLTTADITANNGVKRADVQRDIDFNSLPI